MSEENERKIRVVAGHLNKQPQRPKPAKSPGSRPLMSRAPNREIEEIKIKKDQKEEQKRGNKRNPEIPIPEHKGKKDCPPTAPCTSLPTPNTVLQQNVPPVIP